MSSSNNRFLSSACGWTERDIAIEVQDVSKNFYIYEHRVSSLRERFVRTLRDRNSDKKKTHFSLQDVSLSIGSGETWTFIGPNGAGKSTLLRLIAGIYWPTHGFVTAYGRLAALIDLGAGFHSDLTGKENVYLYSSILGLHRSEVSHIYDEIVEFAGIHDFIDTPVKYFSSGMYVRLAFTVATAIKPDILLLDEIFAVGDAEFSKRCFEKLREFQKLGCTLILATHDLDIAEDFATHALWLDHGEVKMLGYAKDVLSAYKATFQ